MITIPWSKMSSEDELDLKRWWGIEDYMDPDQFSQTLGVTIQAGVVIDPLKRPALEAFNEQLKTVCTVAPGLADSVEDLVLVTDILIRLTKERIPL